MKPKILFLVTSSAWGGAERYVSRLANAAIGRYDVWVMAGTSKGFELFRALDPAVRRMELTELRHPIAPLSDLRAIFRLRAFIDREGIDLIHTNSSKSGLIGALAAAFSKRKPKIVYTAHGWGFLERRSAPFRLAVLWSERLAARHRCATIVLSEKERDVALKMHLSKPEKLHLIPHGIDPEEIAFSGREEARRLLAETAGMPLEPRVVGTIANAYPSKALPLLIAAFAEAAPADTGLVIIGDGPSMREVRAAREASPVKDRIHLLGALPHAARLLKGFDLFVLASVKEGMPWAVLEASLSGVPIVATKVGAIPEMIGDVEGLLVEPGDAQALAKALSRVLNDTTAYETLKRNAPRIAARRSAREMIRKTFETYDACLR